jgi:hypothetical protein
MTIYYKKGLLQYIIIHRQEEILRDRSRRRNWPVATATYISKSRHGAVVVDVGRRCVEDGTRKEYKELVAWWRLSTTGGRKYRQACDLLSESSYCLLC